MELSGGVAPAFSKVSTMSAALNMQQSLKC